MACNHCLGVLFSKFPIGQISDCQRSLGAFGSLYPTQKIFGWSQGVRIHQVNAVCALFHNRKYCRTTNFRAESNFRDIRVWIKLRKIESTNIFTMLGAGFRNKWRYGRSRIIDSANMLHDRKSRILSFAKIWGSTVLKQWIRTPNIAHGQSLYLSAYVQHTHCTLANFRSEKFWHTKSEDTYENSLPEKEADFGTLPLPEAEMGTTAHQPQSSEWVCRSSTPTTKYS